MLIHCKRKSDAIFDGGVVGGGYFSGHTLFVKDNIVTCTYNAFDENYYRIKASKPLAVGRVVRGKYSVPGAFDLAVDNGSLVERRSCTAHFKFNVRD